MTDSSHCLLLSSWKLRLLQVKNSNQYMQMNYRNNKNEGGAPGWHSGCMTNLGSGHDPLAHELEPCLGLCENSSEPGAALDSPSLPLSLPLPCSCSVCLSLKNK